MHILHKVPDGAPVFTPGKSVSKEMDGVEAKGNEKVGERSSLYLLGHSSSTSGFLSL